MPFIIPLFSSVAQDKEAKKKKEGTHKKRDRKIVNMEINNGSSPHSIYHVQKIKFSLLSQISIEYYSSSNKKERPTIR